MIGNLPIGRWRMWNRGLEKKDLIHLHGSEFLWSTTMGCNFSFILVPSWVNFSNRYMYGWSKLVHRGTWMGLTSYTVVHGWVTFPSKLVHGWVMGGGTSKFLEAHPYPDQSWVPPPGATESCNHETARGDHATWRQSGKWQASLKPALEKWCYAQN